MWGHMQCYCVAPLVAYLKIIHEQGAFLVKLVRRLQKRPNHIFLSALADFSGQERYVRLSTSIICRWSFLMKWKKTWSLFNAVQLRLSRSSSVNTRGVLRAPCGRHSECKQSTRIRNTSQPRRGVTSPWCDFLGTSVWTRTCGQCAHRIPSTRMWTGNASAQDGVLSAQVSELLDKCVLEMSRFARANAV